MPRSESLKACLCKLCKGQSFLSSHVVSRHLENYGSFEVEDDENGGQGPNTDVAIANDEQNLQNLEDGASFSPMVTEMDNWDIESDVCSDDDQIVLPSHPEKCEPLDVEVNYDSSSEFIDDSSDFDETNSNSSDSETEELELTMEPGLSSVDVSDDNFKEMYLNPDRQFSEMSRSPLLYPGATSTVLNALVNLFHWFTTHPSLSKKAFSENLRYLHDYILPPGNLLPKSYQEAYQCIKPFLIPEIVYHVCPNDCIIFRKENKNAEQCPKCKEDRFKRNSNGQLTQTPRRTFMYLPISTRVVRNFGTPSIAEALQSHQANVTDDTHGKPILKDLHDSPTWKEVYSEKGMFHGDPRGLSLSLCLDGLNPWSKNKTNYSMWPIVLGQLNLPRKIRTLFTNMILVGIIPAQKDGKEPSNLDPYLEVLVDELLCLTDAKLYDAYKMETFKVKVDVLLYVLDYQGIGKVFSMTGTGSYRGCSWCQLKGIYCTHLRKVIYLGNRRYLTSGHEMRNDTINFPEKSKESRPASVERKFIEDLTYHEAYDNAKNPTQAKDIATATGCRGQYILASKLPEFDRVSKVVPDAMHTIAVCMKHILYLVTGKEPEDSLSVRNAERAFDRFPECWVSSAESCQDAKEAEEENDREATKCGKKRASKRKMNSTHSDADTAAGSSKKLKVSSTKKKLPTAPFTLKAEDIEVADKRVKDIVVPSDCNFTPGPIFSKVSRLNSHALKEIAAKGIAKYCLRGMLARTQRETLFLFLDSIAALCEEEHDPAQLLAIGENLNIAMARMERDFPASLQVITTHIIHHIVPGIQKFGPVHGSWMFPYERFNSWLCRRAMSRKNPEATILRTYQIFEWCQFQTLANNNVNTDQQRPAAETSRNFTRIEIDQENLEKMKLMYQQEVEEYKLLLQVYQQEKVNARKHRKLRAFPTFEKWIPEGRSLVGREQELLAGPKPTAESFGSYVFDQRGRRSHKFKAGESVVYQLGLPTLNFGCVDRIIAHKFAGCDFVWLFCRWYPPPECHPETSIWFSEDKSVRSSPVLVTGVSRPLVIARERNIIWFLDAPCRVN